MVQPHDYVPNVIFLVLGACVMVLLIGFAFQTTSAEFRKDPAVFATVVESRQIWLGGWGVFPIIFILVLLGSLSIIALFLAKGIQTASSTLAPKLDVTNNLLGSLAVRADPLVSGFHNLMLTLNRFSGSPTTTNDMKK